MKEDHAGEGEAGIEGSGAESKARLLPQSQRDEPFPLA